MFDRGICAHQKFRSEISTRDQLQRGISRTGGWDFSFSVHFPEGNQSLEKRLRDVGQAKVIYSGHGSDGLYASIRRSAANGLKAF